MSADVKAYTEKYLTDLNTCMRTLDLDSLQGAVDRLITARKNKNRIYIMGNGGSAATSSHLVNDLNKMCSKGHELKYQAMGLTDNVPIMTAYANDISYADVFSAQLENFLEKDDVVICITGSGNSPNVVKGIEFAKSRGASTIGLLGFDGGKVKENIDHVLWFNDNHYGRVEDAHAVLCHIMANFLVDCDPVL